MKYETFYDLFINNGFTYLTTDGNADIYQRDGNVYRFCFTCGHISKFGSITRFPRGINECKKFLNNYFNEEKKNQTATA